MVLDIRIRPKSGRAAKCRQCDCRRTLPTSLTPNSDRLAERKWLEDRVADMRLQAMAWIVQYSSSKSKEALLIRAAEHR